MANYEDGRITCTDKELIISRYYFPAGAKNIPYAAIREARIAPLGMMGRLRISGSGDFRHWFNYDPGRPRKSTAIVFYLTGHFRPVITPRDPNRVAAELAAHGVNVTNGREPGLF